MQYNVIKMLHHCSIPTEKQLICNVSSLLLLYFYHAAFHKISLIYSLEFTFMTDYFSFLTVLYTKAMFCYDIQLKNRRIKWPNNALLYIIPTFRGVPKTLAVITEQRLERRLSLFFVNSPSKRKKCSYCVVI